MERTTCAICLKNACDRSLPGKVLYDCAAWEQNTANAAMHSAVAGRPLAALYIAYCSQGEWKDKNEKVGGRKKFGEINCS